MIKVQRDNAVLSVKEEDLAQYEARGYKKLGATKKVASKDLEKKINKLAKANEELAAKITDSEKEKKELAKANEELARKVAELEKEVK